MLRQLEQEEDEENGETSEKQLIYLFTAVSAERRLIAYMSTKKRRIMTQVLLKVSPNHKCILDVLKQ